MLICTHTHAHMHTMAQGRLFLEDERPRCVCSYAHTHMLICIPWPRGGSSWRMRGHAASQVTNSATAVRPEALTVDPCTPPPNQDSYALNGLNHALAALNQDSYAICTRVTCVACAQCSQSCARCTQSCTQSCTQRPAHRVPVAQGTATRVPTLSACTAVAA